MKKTSIYTIHIHYGSEFQRQVIYDRIKSFLKLLELQMIPQHKDNSMKWEQGETNDF